MTPLLLADDLTGALDAGVAFTGAGPLRVALRPGAGDAQATIVDLGAREIDPESAREIGRRAGAAATGAQAVFLKIDSLLRGPWPQLLAGVMASGRFARCILAPALPAHGRVTRAGRQRLRKPDGSDATVGPDPATAVSAEGLSFEIWRAGDPPAARVLLREADEDADLARAVKAAAALPGRTLWCGSGGLARALAAQPPALARPAPGRLIAVIGTTAPATMAQVEALRASRPADAVVIGDDAQSAAALLARRDRALCTFDLPPQISHAAAGRRIAERLSALAPLTPPPATVFASGGATLAALCDATGAEGLWLLGRWRDGAPVSRVIGGSWDGVAVISKSGGFGGPELLIDLWREGVAAQI